MDWKTVKDKIIAKRQEIWFNKPAEISRIEVGDIPRGTSVYNQYFTVLMFAEGEMRTMSDELLWHLRSTACKEGIDLATLLSFATSILTYKMQFFDFVGLTQTCQLVKEYIDCFDSIKTPEEFVEITDELLVYINRAHMWVDMIFPWGVSMGFQKKMA